MSAQQSGENFGQAKAGRMRYRLRRRGYAFNVPSGDAMVMDAPAGGCSHGPELEQARATLEQVGKDLEATRLELDTHKETVREANDKLVRARADMENQRRRQMKEKEDLRKFAAEELMRSIIQPMEHFDLAMQSIASATDIGSLRQGVSMIYREFQMVLQANGLEEIKAVGIPFDPANHEAMATENDPSKPDGQVIAVLRTGWMLRGRVLRPAMVKVNKVEQASTPAKGIVVESALFEIEPDKGGNGSPAASEN